MRSSPKDAPSVIDPHLSLKGEIESQGNLVIRGRVEGRIGAQGAVLVATGAFVDADVEASEVQVEGRVRGNISASDRIVLKACGSVEGRLSAPIVTIDEGAELNGRIDMPLGAPEAR